MQRHQVSEFLKSNQQSLLFLTSFLCAILFGFFIGIIQNIQRAPNTPPLSIGEYHHIRPVIELVGSTTDEHLILRSTTMPVRLVTGDDIFALDTNTPYQIPIQQISDSQLSSLEKELQTMTSSCAYVASEKGKIAYKYGSTQASRIQSKRCFTDEQEAISMGLRIAEEDN